MAPLGKTSYMSSVLNVSISRTKTFSDRMCYSLRQLRLKWIVLRVLNLVLLSLQFSFMDESLRWLAANGLRERVMKILEKASKWNGRNLEDVITAFYKVIKTYHSFLTLDCRNRTNRRTTQSSKHSCRQFKCTTVSSTVKKTFNRNYRHINFKHIIPRSPMNLLLYHINLSGNNFHLRFGLTLVK